MVIKIEITLISHSPDCKKCPLKKGFNKVEYILASKFNFNLYASYQRNAFSFKCRCYG